MIRPPPSSPLFPYTTLFRFVFHYCVSAPAALLGVYLMSAYVFMPMAWSSYARRHPALDDAPRITHTASGIAGDPINLALVGSETAVGRALVAAGWDPAHATTFGRCLRPTP